MKKLLIAALALTMTLSMTACDNGPTEAAKESYKVGICQLVQHGALDAATEGFTDALEEEFGEKVTIDLQNASGDIPTCSTITNQFVADGVDLILANATNPLQAAAASTSEIPILGTSVTDFSTALEMDNWTGTTGRNISGTSDLAPLDEQAQMIKDLMPDAKKVSIVYCSAEPNSAYQNDEITKHLKDLGFEVETFTFADSNDVSSVVTAAIADCDVVYVPTDNTVASNTELIQNICLPAKIPVFAGEEATCSGCGVATLTIEYYDIGYAAGEMAVKILKDGEDISKMEIEFAPEFTKKYNKENAEALGIEIPEGYEVIEK